jgi:hypothetical protein
MKNFHIGQLRQTAIFKVNTPTANATTDRDAVLTGGLNDSYSTLLTTRCKLRKSGGGRSLLQGMISDKESFEMICRFQDGIHNNLRIDTKIDILNFRYTIDSWEVIDEIKNFYKFRLNVEKQFALNSTPITDGSYLPASVGVFKLQLTLSAGGLTVSDTDLVAQPGFSITILSLAREGTVLSEGTDFTFDDSTGIVTFINIGAPGGEKIEIVWKNA